MGKQQSNRAKRAEARRVQERRKQMILGGFGLVVLLVIGAVVISGSGSDDRTPSVAAEFELISSEGELVSLTDYRGQPVAVTFMHTW